MNKKYVVFILVLFVSISALTVVCAGETVLVDNVEFNVPDGYHSSSNSSSSTTLKNDAGDEINIHVEMSGGGEMKILGQTGTIAGKSGVIRNLHNDKGESKCEFIYEQSTHHITIMAPNQSTIEQVIK